mmetsp:Transcript_25003/g.73145  ORF Transcript_25003/g.73145 Transcript_25003/m.73145 type:complete len:207 (+) Transcript_25003:1150-1770(+)
MDRGGTSAASRTEEGGRGVLPGARAEVGTAEDGGGGEKEGGGGGTARERRGEWCRRWRSRIRMEYDLVLRRCHRPGHDSRHRKCPQGRRRRDRRGRRLRRRRRGRDLLRLRRLRPRLRSPRNLPVRQRVLLRFPLRFHAGVRGGRTLVLRREDGPRGSGYHASDRRIFLPPGRRRLLRSGRRIADMHQLSSSLSRAHAGLRRAVRA